jgi:hypothetical protein
LTDRRLTTALLLLGLAGCSLSPLLNRIEVGSDAFVVFVGEGSDGRTNIFAGLPVGGELSQITYTPIAETHPALTRAGGAIAFVRASRDPASDPRPTLVVLNLLSGSERDLAFPDDPGAIRGIAWQDDQTAIDVSGANGSWRFPAPPAGGEPVRLTGAERAAADSATAVLLGRPAFARAAPCDSGGICVIGPSGTSQQVSAEGHDPFRWGDDSLAWFEGNRVVVRPLGPGAPRIITWNRQIGAMRQGSYAKPDEK